MSAKTFRDLTPPLKQACKKKGMEMIRKGMTSTDIAKELSQTFGVAIRSTTVSEWKQSLARELLYDGGDVDSILQAFNGSVQRTTLERWLSKAQNELQLATA